MVALIVTFHILAALVLILVVLLQSGKAGDLASTFGSAGTQTAFGARGTATFLTKATTVCAIVFMLTSLSLAVLFTRGSSGTVMDTVPLPGSAPPVESTTQESTTQDSTTQESPTGSPTTPAEEASGEGQ